MASRSESYLTIVTITAILVSAFLLFSVQPLFARMALPLLGGASNVWNTAMVFFQAVLLLGYLYAHLLQKYFSIPIQIAVHATVLAAATIALPIAIPQNFAETSANTPVIQLLMIFAVGTGAPFFALSASAPLLQRWFSKTGHKNADDPYFLYAASNIGSMAALLSYPVIVEPFFAVSFQTELWRGAYFLLIPIILTVGALTLRVAPGSKSPDANRNRDLRPISNASRRRILILSFVPSGLMLAVTTHLTTDIASMPLLWIAPFSLYLLSFIIAFSTTGRPKSQLLRRYAPFVLIIAAVFGVGGGGSPLLIAPTELIAFFLIALICHRELVDERPETRSLTEFYIWMSVGGVLGGIFTAILSPVIFNELWEYPLLLALSASLVIFPVKQTESNIVQKTIRYLLVVVGAMLLLFGPVSQLFADNQAARIIVNGALIGLSAIFIYTERNNKRGFSISYAGFIMLLYASAPALLYQGDDTILRERSFFGTLKVTKGESPLGMHHSLIHGTTIHNHQLRSPAARKTSLAYYGPTGPFGETIAALRAQKGSASEPQALKIAVVGLGAGAIACQNLPGDEWVFFEIDPLIVEIANNPDYFSYISDCAPNAEIHTGDARLVLQSNASLRDFDLLIVDAFSSDSIAAHLITTEALALYFERLKDNGVVVFHTSNRTLDMTSVAIAIGESAGRAARVRRYTPSPANPFAPLLMRSHAVAVGHAGVIEGLYSARPDWRNEKANRVVGVWTDDYSHIIGAFIANKSGPRPAQSD